MLGTMKVWNKNFPKIDGFRENSVLQSEIAI